MPIEFSTILSGDKKMIDIAQAVTLDDLRQMTNQSIDRMLELIADLDDHDITFDPVDPDAYDAHAVEGEEKIGWSIAHIIAHVTASSEEGAAISSLLARGFPTSERPRYETPWRDIQTQAQAVQRLEESRRMRLAYLDTWPDTPHLDIYRDISPRFEEKFGKMNAPAAFLFGYAHEVGHYDQLAEVKRQALAARKVKTA